MNIPNINEIIKETDKNFKYILDERVESLCSFINDKIKEASSKGIYECKCYLINEPREIINTVIKEYKKAKYEAFMTSDGYIIIKWSK